MSVITTDNYFPFTTGPGAGATFPRWRLMARNFVAGGSGVIAGYQNQCFPSMAASIVTIGTGAIWVDGFYAEITTPKPVQVSGNGIVVARLDPTAQVVNLAFAPGQSTPTQTLTDIYEVPLALISGTTLTDIRQILTPAASITLPAGMISNFAGVSAPQGWLMCDGAAYNRNAYAGLWAAVGTRYGAGDGTTTFNVPDLRGRAAIGATSSPPGGISLRALGAAGGEETHTLNSSENGWHGHSGQTGTESAWHIHGGVVDPATGLGPTGYNPGSALGNTGTYIAQRTAFLYPNFQTGNQNALHIHGIPGEGGQPHNNMPPFLALNAIIKT